MLVTEVRIEIVNDDYYRECSPPVLRAVFSIVLDDCMVIHGLKLIEGERGSFLAMPNERKVSRCPDCHHKNPVVSCYCSYCGTCLPGDRIDQLRCQEGGRTRLYTDILHPLTRDFRDYLTDMCRDAYRRELASPGSTLPLSIYEPAKDVG